jgi:uncharacterized repeat protein (TIGR03803 family)
VKRSHAFRICLMAFIVAALTFLTTRARAADRETVLHNFSGGADGATPTYLIRDSSGNLYGLAEGGGNMVCSGGCGVIFKMSNSSGRWVETILYTFTGGDDGADPSGIVMDSTGSIYGFSSGAEGSLGPGSAFKLSRATGGGWTFSLLYKFGTATNDGLYPAGAPVLDAAGNIYGSTRNGGSSTACTAGCGTVFELTPAVSGLWPETILHSFSGVPDGAFPAGSMIFDGVGNLYGNTNAGGSNTTACNAGCGAVYQVAPASGGSWTESILHSFNGSLTDGIGPEGGIAIDATGNLYGTTYEGGRVHNSGCFGYCGTVWEVSPVSGGGWSEKLLHSFNYTTDGGLPSVGVVLDSAGHVYGFTATYPNTLAGTAYKLSEDHAGQWQITVLYALGTTNGDGKNPAGGSPVLDSAGNLYGTARFGGTKDNGNIFKLAPAPPAEK